MSGAVSKKGWTQQEDQLIREIMENDRNGSVRWIDVSTLILQRTGRHRTGKQCRERWQHQLKPSIVRKQWTEAEITTLFQKQSEFGNKWALISNFLPGRTDNAVKNYFYSSVRRVLTTINTQLGNQRALKEFKTIRYFQSDYLSKLMAVVDGNFDRRVRLTSPEAFNLAKNILNKITTLVLNQVFRTENTDSQCLDSMILAMQQFRKKCIKRKHVEIIQEENLRQTEPQKQVKYKPSQRDMDSKQTQELQKNRENYANCRSTSIINYLLQNQDLQSNKTLQSFKNQSEDHIASLQAQKLQIKLKEVQRCCVQTPNYDVSKIVNEQTKGPIWSILGGEFFFNEQQESILSGGYQWRQNRGINAFDMVFSYPSDHSLDQRYDLVQQISTTKMLEASMALDECYLRQKKSAAVELRNL